jgi:hypothetical protein
VSQSESRHDVIDPEPKRAGPFAYIDRNRLHIRALVVVLTFSQGLHQIGMVSSLGRIGITYAVRLSDTEAHIPRGQNHGNQTKRSTMELLLMMVQITMPAPSDRGYR